MRSTPTNQLQLLQAETEFVNAKEEALEQWSESLCTKINEAKNLKEKWTQFRKFTKRNDDNKILPFIQPDGNILFEEPEKGDELEQTFFKGKHLKLESFDNEFYKEIMRKYAEITMTEDEMEEEYYNNVITMDELEGAIARLKKESAPGPDCIFTNLILNAGESMISAILYLFNKSWKEGTSTMEES